MNLLNIAVKGNIWVPADKANYNLQVHSSLVKY